MHYSGFTRKMAGVLYRAVKEGKLQMDRRLVNTMYAYADMYTVSEGSEAEKEKGFKDAVDAVFAGDYEAAQASIDRVLFWDRLGENSEEAA